MFSAATVRPKGTCLLLISRVTSVSMMHITSLIKNSSLGDMLSVGVHACRHEASAITSNIIASFSYPLAATKDNTARQILGSEQHWSDTWTALSHGKSTVRSVNSHLTLIHTVSCRRSATQSCPCRACQHLWRCCPTSLCLCATSWCETGRRELPAAGL